jgi:hypothetical protein
MNCAATDRLVLTARNGPVYAGTPYRNFFPSWISYRHSSPTIFIYRFPFFLAAYPCFAFKKETGSSKFPFRALLLHINSVFRNSAPYKSKSKAVPLPPLRHQGGEEVKFLLILDLGNRWVEFSASRPAALYPRYPLYRRLGGFQSWSGHGG